MNSFADPTEVVTLSYGHHRFAQTPMPMYIVAMTLGYHLLLQCVRDRHNPSLIEAVGADLSDRPIVENPIY